MHKSPRTILFIVTSAPTIGPHKRTTGYEFSEVAHPYLVFKAHGLNVAFASPKGGKPPEDGYQANDSASAIFRNGPGFQALNSSTRLADLDLDAFDAVFFPGGLGPMVDMLGDPTIEHAIARMYDRGRWVGAVCHGPVALLGVQLSDGSQLLDGKRCTCFTTAEELGHSDQDVPFMLDDAMGEQGARHSHAAPFAPHVVTDGRLVTGQNPASAAGVAQAMAAGLGL